MDNLTKSPLKPWKKGPTRGKGGPHNASCEYRRVRQRTWGKWVAEIREPKKHTRRWLGSFATTEEVAMAYDEAARRLYGPDAYLNQPHLRSNINSVVTGKRPHRFKWFPSKNFTSVIPSYGLLNLSTQHNIHVIHQKLQDFKNSRSSSSSSSSSSCPSLFQSLEPPPAALVEKNVLENSFYVRVEEASVMPIGKCCGFVTPVAGEEDAGGGTAGGRRMASAKLPSGSWRSCKEVFRRRGWCLRRKTLRRSS